MKILFLLLVGFFCTSVYAFGYRFHIINPVANVKNFGSYRAWSDGTFAKSCNAYKNNLLLNRKYSGFIGDGVYRIKPDTGSPFNVYCDMTVDGGGWTLIASVSGSNTNHYNSTTDTNISTADFPIPYENIQSGRKLSDARVKAIAGDNVYKFEMARNQAKSGTDFKYAVFYKMNIPANFSFANKGGLGSHKIYVSYSYPYVWEAETGSGYEFGCGAIYHVFDGHAATGTSCGNGTSGNIWLSSGYINRRLMVGYSGGGGFFGGTEAFVPNNSGNPGYAWVR